MPWGLLLNKYVLIGIAFAVLTATAGFYKWRADHWKGKYETYVIEVRAVGMAAEAKAKETEAKQAKTTQEVRVNAKRNADRITAYYERRLRESSADSGGLPSSTGDPRKPDGTAAEPVASGPGFERACALDADQVNQFQAWVRAQGIPVR